MLEHIQASMFEIESFGFDKVIEDLEKMSHGLTEEGFNEYCNKVKEYAKRKCDLKENEITLEAVKNGDEISVSFNTRGEKLACVKQAIEENLNSMPITTKALFEHLLKEIEKKLKSFDNKTPTS